MPGKTTPEDRFLDAALAAIVKSGWRSLSLAAVARKAKLSTAQLYDFCPDRRALLGCIARRIDIAAIGLLPEPDADSPARDRAFDALMAWFEALAEIRDAAARVHEDGSEDPGVWIDAWPAALRSARWLSEMSLLSPSGLRGQFAVHGLAVLLLETIPVWLGDDEGLSRTMAHIDRRLRMFEEWSENWNAARDGGEEEEEDEDGAD